jgi:hypothetical protein
MKIAAERVQTDLLRSSTLPISTPNLSMVIDAPEMMIKSTNAALPKAHHSGFYLTVTDSEIDSYTGDYQRLQTNRDERQKKAPTSVGAR